MSLRNEQEQFTRDLIKLLLKAHELGFTVTIGEVQRPLAMQKLYVKLGRSKTFNSMHLKKCAVDLNLFLDGKLIYDVSLVKPLGEYWESLNPKNQWGGHWKSFKDVPHFQRTV